MENPRDIARASWRDAQKIRTDILAKISNLKKERGNINYTTRFEEAEETMAELRLACMQVIFRDFEYGFDKKVEHSLWQAHTFLNGEYRKVMSRLMSQNQVVQRRKLDKLYRGFLKTSESFYRVYIQRLSGRFYIPELRQAAYGTDLEPTQAMSDNVQPPATLRAMILKSCQTTLVRLGDLARYRCQISDKLSKATFDKALDYYGLANIIDAEDGSAHHQMAVLYQVQGQHLDIVYHFYRAIAIAKPHELGLGNVEREFKGLENSASSRRGPVKDPSEAMITWFVRLHAFYFQGKQFSQQSELEEEVLHRVEIAMKSEGNEATLRKMILINIAAYDVATDKVKTSWTMEASQSCQFLLRFNVRTILILLRLLKTAFYDETVPVPEAASKDNDADTTISFGPALMKLLPFLRIYISWIYITRADFIKYQEYLEPHLREAYSLLADSLTLLNVYVDPTLATTSSKYLLPEDAEAQGLRPLNDRKLPLFLHVGEQEGTKPPKRQKTRKPRQIVFGRQFKPETETVWRIRDIVCCGVFLAGSTKFPLGLTVSTQGDREMETWVFTEDGPLPVYSDEASMARIMSKLSPGDPKAAPERTVHKGPDSSAAGMASVRPIQANMDNITEPIVKPDGLLDKGKSLENPPPAFLDADLSEDSEMINMVNKLLDPMDDDRPRSSQTQAEPSYGMNSSTANEVFGLLDASPAQPSPVSKTIPNLPWGYFYTPTPHRSTSQGQNQLGPDQAYVPRSATAQFDGSDSSPYLNDLDNPLNQPNRDAFSPRTGATYAAPGPALKTSSGGNSPQDEYDAYMQTSRNAVLDSLTSALYAQHGLSSPGTSHLNNKLAPSHMERSSSRHDTSARIQSPIGQGRPSANQGSFPRLKQQYAKPSNIGDVQPLGPFQRQRDASAMAYQQEYQSYSPWLPEPAATGSSLAFSHPSSLYGGTPAHRSPSQSVACNGNMFSASTPFGRLGGGTNNRDEPTHFRNQLKEATGSAELSYDQQILQAALMNNLTKPRPK
ncbi:Uu.00g004790.m01.CDS01 [Anthostomella pinea]|uniref:Nonsense-mediated mRNA decay factor n=1 Tax=Anthostomella pinea TaxID=933095 RepID=A0AAI8VK20_9PEZI|nr:Uu.00g004790.m01.CDS01 [Anthostomella pinea]